MEKGKTRLFVCSRRELSPEEDVELDIIEGWDEAIAKAKRLLGNFPGDGMLVYELVPHVRVKVEPTVYSVEGVPR